MFLVITHWRSMRKCLTLEKKMRKRIARKTGNVFLREDFKDLGGYDQVGRVLKQLADKQEVIRIGYGLYAKACLSALTGEPVLAASLPTLGQEALTRLNIKTVPSKAEMAYQAGQSTQVPTGRLIGVKTKISRKIGYKGASIKYEYVA